MSGEPPFQSDDIQALLTMHLQHLAPSLKVAAPRVPTPVAEIVEVLLAKKPANRYASAQRVLELLQQVASSTPADSGTSGTPDGVGPAAVIPESVSTDTVAVVRRRPSTPSTEL